MDKIKGQLAGVAALLGVIAAIGGGFVKYGEITTKLDTLENADTSHSHDTSHAHDDTNIKIVQKEIDIIKLDIQELKEKSKNPLAN